MLSFMPNDCIYMEFALITSGKGKFSEIFKKLVHHS